MCVCGEMIDFGESDKVIKISRKVDKSDTYKGLSSNISIFIREFLQTNHFLIFFYKTFGKVGVAVPEVA